MIHPVKMRAGELSNFLKPRKIDPRTLPKPTIPSNIPKPFGPVFQTKSLSMGPAKRFKPIMQVRPIGKRRMTNLINGSLIAVLNESFMPEKIGVNVFFSGDFMSVRYTKIKDTKKDRIFTATIEPSEKLDKITPPMAAPTIETL